MEGLTAAVAFDRHGPGRQTYDMNQLSTEAYNNAGDACIMSIASVCQNIEKSL